MPVPPDGAALTLMVANAPSLHTSVGLVVTHDTVGKA